MMASGRCGTVMICEKFSVLLKPLPALMRSVLQAGSISVLLNSASASFWTLDPRAVGLVVPMLEHCSSSLLMMFNLSVAIRGARQDADSFSLTDVWPFVFE